MPITKGQRRKRINKNSLTRIRSQEGGGYNPTQHQGTNRSQFMSMEAMQIYMLEQILAELKKLNERP